MTFFSVLIAAGQSSRMGEDKALLEIGDKKCINFVLKKLLSFSDKVVVVLGDNFKNVKKYVPVKDKKVIFVYNPSHLQGGMLSSIKVGFKTLTSDRPTFLQMIDQPFVKKETYKFLIKSFDNSNLFIQPVGKLNQKGKKGHPILFGTKFRKILLENKTSKTFRDIMLPIKQRGKFVEVDDLGVVQNLNDRKLFLNGLQKYQKKMSLLQL